MSTNPYASPDNPFGPPQEHPHYQTEDGFVRQLPVVGVLNIVQGSLEILLAIALVGMTIFLANIDRFAPNGGRPPEQMPVPVLVIQAIMAGAVLLIGMLRIIAGASILRRRNRVLAIVTSAAGIVTAITCYCAPTSIALAIYSLIVLLQPSVISAFERQRA